MVNFPQRRQTPRRTFPWRSKSPAATATEQIFLIVLCIISSFSKFYFSDGDLQHRKGVGNGYASVAVGVAGLFLPLGKFYLADGVLQNKQGVGHRHIAA